MQIVRSPQPGSLGLWYQLYWDWPRNTEDHRSNYGFVPVRGSSLPLQAPGDGERNKVARVARW